MSKLFDALRYWKSQQEMHEARLANFARTAQSVTTSLRSSHFWERKNDSFIRQLVQETGGSFAAFKQQEDSQALDSEISKILKTHRRWDFKRRWLIARERFFRTRNRIVNLIYRKRPWGA